MAWLKRNLFSSWGNAVASLVALALIAGLIAAIVDWALVHAVWRASSGADCQGHGYAACWPFISANLGQFIYGPYPADARWRADLAFLVGAGAILFLTLPRVPFKQWIALGMVTVYPLAAFVLLSGGFGLAHVPTHFWGGLLVTLVVAASGMAGALPLGILLALGRRSELPVLRWTSVAFIELWRGVPLITVLFMASVMLPLFLPPGTTFDLLLRCIIGVTLFSAAYMAEVVRGGLQAIPRGQYEAAEALGLGYWRMTALVILPQALRLVIPGMVNTFIGLFKDTTLVLIVGLADLLGMVQRALNDPYWAAPGTAATGYLFAGALFWLACFAMSRYAQAMELKLAQKGTP
jgi:general L-amino acid transport system permease protein